MENANNDIYGYEPVKSTKRIKNDRARRKKTGLIYLAMVLVVIIIAVVLFCGVLLKVSGISVAGASRYTLEQIEEACSIKVGDNLVTADKENAIKNIQEKLPYIGYVEVKKRLPSVIEVYVEEAEISAVIEQGGTYICISKEGKVLEICNEPKAGYTIIDGILLILPEEGKYIQFQNTNVKDIYVELMNAFEKNNSEKIDLIDISDISNITFTYDNRVKVKLGIPEDINYKVSFALNVLKNEDGTGLSETDKGELDLSRAGSTDRAIFTPYEELNEDVSNENSENEGENSTESSAE